MIPVTLCKFKHKFTAAIILSQKFITFILQNKHKEKLFFFTIMLLSFKGRKKPSLFSISPPMFFVLHLFMK